MFKRCHDSLHSMQIEVGRPRYVALEKLMYVVWILKYSFWEEHSLINTHGPFIIRNDVFCADISSEDIKTRFN